MAPSRPGFDYYYEKARGNGRSRDAAFEYAAHKYLDMVYDLQNFSEDKVTREDLVLSMLIKYHKQRDRRNTHKEALSHVLKFAREEIEHHIEKVNAANKGRRGRRNAFEGLEDLLDALPEDVLGSGWHSNGTGGRRMPPMPAGVDDYTMPPPIFDDIRAAQEAAGLGGRTYRAEERRPGGGVRDERARPSSSSYFTEERRPGGSGSSRHASYTFDERRPGRNGRDEYMPPRHTSSYTNEERRPGGSGRYSTDDRRPRAHARSPSPPRRGPSHHSQRPSYSSSSSSNKSYSSSSSSNKSYSSSSSYEQTPPTYTTNSHTHRPHHRPRSPSPAPDPYPNHIKPTSDLYRVLNLPRSASNTEIKAARRRLGLLHHPDKAKAQGLSEKEATEKMREINLACDVLGDEEGRKWYDRTGRLPAGR